MNEPLISAYKWLICLGETAAVFLFFKSKFKCEKPRLYFAVAIMPIVASLVFVVGRLHIPSALIAVIDTVIFVLYAFVCFDASPTVKCIWSVVPSLFFCISEFICLVLIILIGARDNGDVSLEEGAPAWIVWRLVYSALNFGMLLPLMKVKSADGEMPARLRAATTVLSLTVIVVSAYCLSKLMFPLDSRSNTASWILCSALLILSVAMILLSDHLAKLYQKHLETQKELQKAKLEAEHVSQVRAMYDHVRGWRHDISGMTSTIISLAERGEYDSMKEYLRELNGTAEETKLLISTGNPALDATISAKLMLADKNGITVNHTVSIPENLEIENADICSIIMNIMDNAIEAAATLPEKDRCIDLEMIDKGGMLAIKVKNTCRGDYKFDGKRLLTTKAESSVHGIGLRRVSSIVERHQGFIKVEPKENSFEVDILLPVERRAEK